MTANVKTVVQEYFTATTSVVVPIKEKVVEEKLELRILTLEEISWHDNECDCWVVIYDRVYDVTNFLEEKPISLDMARNLNEYGTFKKPVSSREKESLKETQKTVLQAVAENSEI
ncbi:unnamed protein product [Acanthoscelides obtectus]|uniref:Cytochrome b5 heme-binding domain-containing protein n=1 Tax=Acanthoscelides obtectus TaxID=200917 RepID=A0A9P0LSU0_ACAOB|nr:unnamed protein product [Acanthoscelides obtectus]CAK1678077.1 hypothetical protein AOBTE_LOCUS31744 [Acanthoscelides obtectus]